MELSGRCGFRSPMRAALCLAIALALPGCSSSQSDSVLVDRMGVSDAKYNQDMADCKKSSPAVPLSLSNPVATCMTAKGYKVLMGKSML